jgi:hypothetical protein
LASFGSIKSEFKTSARAPNDDSSDSDDTPDYLDTDSDGDTISDANESDLTTISGVSYADPDGNVNDPLDNADGSIILENADNDSGDVDFRSLEVPPGFTLSSTWSTIWENSGTWSYTIVLNSQPTSDVVIDLSSDDTDEATVSPASLTFTSANWDTAQTVTVTWVNDNLVATHSAVITATINDGSSANEYDPLSDQTHTVTLTDDDTSPSAPTITSVDGDTTDPYLTNDVTPDVIFSAGSWSTVTISWWTCTPTPVWAAWTVTCTPDANLSSGTTTGITPTIADQYGNPTVGTPFSITVDNTDPSTPTVDSLSPNPAQTGTTVTLSLSTVEPGTSVTVPWLTCSPDPVTASGTVDCSWTASWGLLDGSNNIVTVTDPAWNTNTGATSPTLIIDDTAPTLTLTTPTDVTPSNVTAYPITGSCTANGDTIDIAITDGDTPINTATWSVVCTGWSYTGSLDLSGLDDGTMNITVDSTDASGNSATQATDTADKDVLAPTITPNTLPVINEDNQSSLELTGSCTAPWDTISISLTDWSNTATWSTTCWTWGSYTWSLDASSLTDGTIDFIGTINDGTNPAITATGSTTQDTVDPTVTIITSVDVIPGNVATYPVIGSCSANGDTIDITITDGDSPANTATWSTTCTWWAYTWSLDLSGLNDGTLNIASDITDAAWNEATQATDTTDKDVLAPTITLNTIPTINEDTQSAVEVTWSCTAPWDNISFSLTDSTNTASWATTCGSSGTFTWSLDLSGFDDGTINLVATIDDGTNPTITATWATSMDSVDPTVTITSPADVIPTNESSYPVVWSCTANGDTVNITVTDWDSPVNTATGSTTCTWGSYTWSLDVSGLDDGTLNITSDITDAAGNTATQATDTTDKDTLAPTITPNTIPTINEDTQSAVAVTGSCSAVWDSISISLTDGSNTATWATTCGSGWTFTGSLDVSWLDDGTLDLTTVIDDGTNPTVTATWATTMDSIVNNPTVDSTSPSPAKDGTSVTTKLSSVEPWASVSIPGMTCSPDPATVSGTVDCIGIVWTGWLDGVNKIVSITDWAGNTNSGSTIVLVIDNTAPVITSSTGVTLPVGASFTDTPPTCSDNTDSSCSVTSSWSVDTATVWIYTITYTATDAAGNTNTTTKTINITLWNPPVITLLGSGSLQVIQSASYTDAGATANDSENGNITSSISATGAVDTSTLWAYIITYNVTDSSGNSATPVTRNVQVISSLNDFDGDGLSNLLEAQLGTDPLKADTDWDGTNDNNNDKDNVTPAIELAAPNAGDGNGDGTIDAIQNAVSSLPNIANAQYNSLEISNAGSCGQIQYFASKRESALWAQDSEFDYDLGLWDFEIACTNTGATANIQIYLDKTYDTSSWVYRKFNEVTDIYTDISSIVNYTTETVWTWSLAVDVTVINYSITDGGTYDEDGVANAIIIDPSGPSVPVVVTGGGWRTYSCRDVDATNYRTYGFSQPDLCEYSSVEEVVVIPNPKSEEEISEKIEIIEELEVIKWEDYTLENSFDHCPIITDIQNPNYPHASTGVFIDESESHFQDLVLKFSEIGIVDGYDDGTFKPLQEMTRTEFLKVALISHCYKYRDLGGNTPYTDVEVGTWQSRVIERAQELKMINGDITEDGISVFRPNDIITKAEATKILMRISMIQAEDTQTTRYSDISVDWHNKYIENGEALGLFDSREDNYSFYPDSGVQREDMVDIINRLVQSYK